MRSAEILLHPALVSDLHRIINVSVIVSDSRCVRARNLLICHETHLVAIRRARVVCGVGPHIVGGVLRQIGNTAGKGAGTVAVGGMVVAYRRVGRSTPTHPAGGHRYTAVSGHVAATSGGVGCDVAGRSGEYGGKGDKSGVSTTSRLVFYATDGIALSYAAETQLPVDIVGVKAEVIEVYSIRIIRMYGSTPKVGVATDSVVAVVAIVASGKG